MIFIARYREDDNGKEIIPTEEGFADAATATETAIEEQQAHDANGDIYAHTQVKRTLEKLFHNKCAYCETPITPGADWDVEHYRPKGKVSECNIHPGYYWLAYDWENLYPSCPHCNQNRKDKPLWDDETELPTAGKMYQFPLLDESQRSMSHEDDIDKEEPYLLDPNVDHPEEYFTYDIQGQVVAVDDDPRAKKTMEICHLTRRRLRDAKLLIIAATVQMMGMIRSAEESGEQHMEQQLRDWFQVHLLGDGCRYAAVARAVDRDPDAFGV